MDENMVEQEYDVIVVGAGISGSNAAYILKKRCPKLRILVIEAKDRVGGRTLTKHLKSANGTSKWDIGGQWVTDSQRNVTKLMKELNIETYRQYDEGKKLLLSNGKLSVYNSSVPCSSFLSWLDMQLYMKRVDKHVVKIDTTNAYKDKATADYLDGKNLKEFLCSKSLTPTVRSIFNSNMRTIYGLEIDQVNALFGLMYVRSGGGNLEAITYSDEGCAQEKRVKGGTQQISKKLLESVMESPDNKLLLNTALIEVVQDEETEQVQLVTRNTLTDEKITFRARYVISSLPINQYAMVNFAPELPMYKRNFFKFCQIGNYIKFLVTYKTPFWRAKGLSGEGTSDGSYIWLNEDRFKEVYAKHIGKITFNRQLPSIGAVAEVFDGTNEDGEPALVGFVAAKAAVEWGDQSEEVRRNEIIEGLVLFYGEEARNYVDFVDKNWNLEPYSGGCPAFNVSAPGLMKDYARALREPFGSVHFCGTESATEWQGYMDGAVESGERVANEVLYRMFGLNDNAVKVEYGKTYYSQKEHAICDAAKSKQLARCSLACLTKSVFKISVVVGASYFLLCKLKTCKSLSNLSNFLIRK